MKKQFNQDDIFEPRGELVEYVPRVRKPVAEITPDDVVDKLMDIHDMALSDEKPNYTAALKAVELVAKMTGMLESGKVAVNIGQSSSEPAQINFVGVKPKNASD